MPRRRDRRRSGLRRHRHPARRTPRVSPSARGAAGRRVSHRRPRARPRGARGLRKVGPEGHARRAPGVRRPGHRHARRRGDAARAPLHRRRTRAVRRALRGRGDRHPQRQDVPPPGGADEVHGIAHRVQPGDHLDGRSGRGPRPGGARGRDRARHDPGGRLRIRAHGRGDHLPGALRARAGRRAPRRARHGVSVRRLPGGAGDRLERPAHGRALGRRRTRARPRQEHGDLWRENRAERTAAVWRHTSRHPASVRHARRAPGHRDRAAARPGARRAGRHRHHQRSSVRPGRRHAAAPRGVAQRQPGAYFEPRPRRGDRHRDPHRRGGPGLTALPSLRIRPGPRHAHRARLLRGFADSRVRRARRAPVAGADAGRPAHPRQPGAGDRAARGPQRRQAHARRHGALGRVHRAERAALLQRRGARHPHVHRDRGRTPLLGRRARSGGGHWRTGLDRSAECPPVPASGSPERAPAGAARVEPRDDRLTVGPADHRRHEGRDQQPVERYRLHGRCAPARRRRRL